MNAPESPNLPPLAPAPKKTVAIIDDDRNTLEIIEAFLEKSADFVCAGSFATPGEALRVLPGNPLDIALIDYLMPEMNGLECARRLKSVLPELKVVIITGSPGDDTLNAAIRDGSDNYLCKPFHPRQVVASLKIALAHQSAAIATDGALFPVGQNWQSAIGNRKSAMSTPPTAPLPPVPPGLKSEAKEELSPLDHAVMVELARGLQYGEIAEFLGWSYTKVRKHQHAAFRKLGEHTRTEALNKWRARYGWN